MRLEVHPHGNNYDDIKLEMDFISDTVYGEAHKVIFNLMRNKVSTVTVCVCKKNCKKSETSVKTRRSSGLTNDCVKYIYAVFICAYV